MDDVVQRLVRARKGLGAAQKERDAAIRAAAKAGMPYREIAGHVGLSGGRVAQILKATR